ncbi:hypothetical protein [Pseudarthrobacter sp. MM222]|uniref:hypothetical protein n=1 Tax=Pseudarthrobacter sp. MM222 TaxID=3018929 RepID=UPI003FA6CB7A
MGLMLVTVYAVAGTLQTLVWNPLAAVPGATMAEIHAGLDRANESLGAPVVIVWAVVGVLLAAIVVVGAVQRPDLPVKNVLVIDLLLLVLAAPSHWYAAFPAGMGIADAFATHGGDHAPWGLALYASSAMALAALFVVAMISRFGRADTAP